VNVVQALERRGFRVRDQCSTDVNRGLNLEGKVVAHVKGSQKNCRSQQSERLIIARSSGGLGTGPGLRLRASIGLSV